MWAANGHTVHVGDAGLDERVLNHEASRAEEHSTLGYELVNCLVWDPLKAYLHASPHVMLLHGPALLPLLVRLLSHLTPVDTLRYAARLQVGAQHRPDCGRRRVRIALYEAPRLSPADSCYALCALALP